MIELKNDELMTIKGGFSISGSLLNSFSSLIKSILEVGRGIGSSIRRVEENKVCPL